MAVRMSFASRVALVATLGIGAALAVAGGARADKGLNDGIYRDRDEKQHAWVIQRSHLVTWNDQHYVPAGLVFHSRYLKEPTPEHLQADAAELDRLKSAGVQDIWIEPGRGLLENTPEQTQAVIDAVEARGFRYGLRVGDRSRSPLIGFSPVLPPVHVPPARLQSGARETWTVSAPRGRRAIFALVDQPNRKTNNWVVGSGETLVEKDLARVDVQIRKTSLLGKVAGTLFVVPEIQVDPEEMGSFGDLWESMSAYSERLKKHLQALKFGPGLRFVLDPFAAGDGTVGQEDLVFPSSEAFRKGFAEWLKRQGGIPTLNNRWRTNDQRIPGFVEAARLVPMWSRNDPPEGDGWLMDPVDRVFYRVVARDCRIWSDLAEFRAESLKRWMNVLCTTLRQEGLNVPMLFTWTSYHPIFINSPSPAGYDGLGAELYGTPESVTRDAAYALGQAEESDRNTWLIATRLAGPLGSDGKPAPISDGATLSKTLEQLRSTGFRGFYLDPEQVPNAAALVREAAGAMSAATLDPKARPQVLFFPMALATADRVTRFPNGVWWLPSGRPARLLRFGDYIFGYQMDYPFGDEHEVRHGMVIWSTEARREVTFYDDKLARVSFYDSAGKPLPRRTKKQQLLATLSPEPIVAAGGNAAALFPLELAADLLQEFDYLLTQAEKQKLDSAGLRPLYDQADRALSTGSAAQVYESVLPYVERLRQELQPFQWIEGEESTSHNFSSIAFQPGASAGTYLKVDLPRTPASGAFQAIYAFELRRDASYEFWMAGKIPGRTASPMLWQVDDEPAVPARADNVQSVDYSAGMGWSYLGRMTLKAGRHELVLVVTDPTAAGRYQAGIDAIVISQNTFKPNGTDKPRLYTPAPEDEGRKKRDRKKRDDEPRKGEKESADREKPERKKKE